MYVYFQCLLVKNTFLSESVGFAYFASNGFDGQLFFVFGLFHSKVLVSINKILQSDSVK